MKSTMFGVKVILLLLVGTSACVIAQQRVASRPEAALRIEFADGPYECLELPAGSVIKTVAQDPFRVVMVMPNNRQLTITALGPDAPMRHTFVADRTLNGKLTATPVGGHTFFLFVNEKEVLGFSDDGSIVLMGTDGWTKQELVGFLGGFVDRKKGMPR